ncbi:hypothetical protein ACYCVF_35465 [Bradyrhizobium sp. 1.29L]
MQGESSEPDNETQYYMLPEEALQFFPEEWREHFQAMADNGRAVLESVEKELSQLARISNSFNSLAALKYSHKRLSEHKFAPDMESVLELDMLTTAFVVSYVRLHQGGIGSGFSRDVLPENLRPIHDQIIDMRNKRFAHNDEHHSSENAMRIESEGNRFYVIFNLKLGYYIAGATEWHELVKFLDAMTVERMQKVFARLNEKTGYEWIMPTGPAPE